MKNSKLLMVGALAACLVLSACDNGDPTKRYTYRSWTTALADKWNPHTWETNADSSMLGYVSEGFMGLAPLNTATQEWQWTYDLAESVTDVTNDHKDDLVKYGVMEEEPEEAEQYVYEIKLRQGAKFEEKRINGKTYGGKEIKADDYIESFKLLLDPARKNYRANSYYSDDTQVAGGDLYYYQGSAVPLDNCRDGDDNPVYEWGDIIHEGTSYLTPDTKQKVYIAYAQSLVALGGNTIDDYAGAGYVDEDTYEALVALDEEETGLVELNDSTFEAVSDFILASTMLFTDISDLTYLIYVDTVFGECDWSKVGLYKADDYTLRYVLAKPYDIDNFKTFLTSSWLVENDLYKDLSETDANTGLVTTKYATSKDTTISYGPYKLTNFEDGKQVKFEKNEFWRGYTKNEDGTLSSKTSYKVNGEYQNQYQTTHIVIDVMDQKTAKQKFEKGELNDYNPTPDELVSEYSRSSQLYQVLETYTMRLFFNTDKAALQKMDREEGNVNSVVMSNANFRKAFSLAIDRADWVTNTEGYVPAYSLINSLYYYDVFNDPASIYRNTDEAKQSIVDLYGIEYGPGKAYATLDEAYASVSGYNLTEARQLMKTAYEELLAEGSITAGANIKIRLAWKKGALEAPDQAQVKALNDYLTAALQGSGFGTIELEAVGNIAKRYEDVPAGKYAIGYGAWGGAAFYPFTMFRVYMDPAYTDIHEAACWDPSKVTFTFNVNGEQVTMSAQAWSKSMAAGGKYANADNETKLSILSQIEKTYLELYYCIPLATSTACSLLGYQQDYFTQDYNIMYDFGGFALMKYKYNDAEWEAYVKSQGGKLDYTK